MIRQIFTTRIWYKIPSFQSYRTMYSKCIINKQMFSFSISKQTKLIIQDELKKLRINIDGSQKNLYESGIVKDLVISSNQKVTIAIQTNKNFARLKNIIKRKINEIGYNDVQIVLQQKQDRKVFQRKGNLSGVKKIIAVSSCKGGVGKSTIAVNIAFGLKKQGYKVGIFDSDIYGPSLPTLVNKQGEKLKNSKNSIHILPVQVYDIKCMSFGFVNDKNATIRGPMASSIASQLILNTEWGQLDYLIVDMPPGTGDVNLSLCQEVKLDGAVIVTTPQKLSFVDVLKGIQMFKQLQVKILAVVENMSYYVCSKCQNIDQVFGKGHQKLIADQLGIQSSFRIPMLSQISKCSDIGIPFIISSNNQNLVVKTYLEICDSLVKQASKPKVRIGAFYSTAQRLIIVEQQKKQKKIDPIVLRSKCKCQHCINDETGQILVKMKQIDPQTYPVKIQQKGNYAIGVTWSDGHKNSIYSYKRLMSEQIPSK